MLVGSKRNRSYLYCAANCRGKGKILCDVAHNNIRRTASAFAAPVEWYVQDMDMGGSLLALACNIES